MRFETCADHLLSRYNILPTLKIMPPLKIFVSSKNLPSRKTTAFYLSRPSRELQDILTNRPGEMKSLENIKE
jgi:hypothetical protein